MTDKASRQAAARAKVRAAVYADKLRRVFRPLGLAGAFDGTLQGDAAAFDALLGRLPREAWAQVVLAMHLAETPNLPTRRDLLRLVWMRKHIWLAATCRVEKINPLDLFAACQFAVPADLPDTVAIYHGTAGIPIAKARAGLSWTTDRAGAAWFATAGLSRTDEARVECRPVGDPARGAASVNRVLQRRVAFDLFRVADDCGAGW